MGANVAAEERAVLIVHPEIRDGEYEVRILTPAARQILLNEWGCAELLPTEKKKLDDSVVTLFNYASSVSEKVLVKIEGNRQCVAVEKDMSASVVRCLELIREKSQFVLGIPINDLPELARLIPVTRISAA